VDAGTAWTGSVVRDEPVIPTLDELTKKPRKTKKPNIGRFHVWDMPDMAGTLRGFERFDNAWEHCQTLEFGYMRDTQRGGFGQVWPTPGECGKDAHRTTTRKKVGTELHTKIQHGFKG